MVIVTFLLSGAFVLNINNVLKERLLDLFSIYILMKSVVCGKQLMLALL
jgi:hypothetical protein